MNVAARVADRMVSWIVPSEPAHAVCGYSYRLCFCRGGLRYSKRCRDCTGDGSGCGPCNIITGTC